MYAGQPTPAGSMDRIGTCVFIIVITQVFINIINSNIIKSITINDPH